MKSIPSELARELRAAYTSRIERNAPTVSETSLAPGETLIHQGDTPKSVFIILEGRLKIHHITPKGTDYLVAVEGPGEIIGEVEALTGEPYTCSASGVKPAVVAAIPCRTYARWLKEDHGFALLVNQALCHRLQKATRRSAIHQSYPLEYSVLRLLRMLAEEARSRRVDVGKEEMAHYLATNTRSINRILKGLQERNVIRVGRGVEIQSMEALDRAMQTHDE